jgi:hypothetical protein
MLQQTAIAVIVLLTLGAAAASACSGGAQTRAASGVQLAQMHEKAPGATTEKAPADLPKPPTMDELKGKATEAVEEKAKEQLPSMPSAPAVPGAPSTPSMPPVPSK